MTSPNARASLTARLTGTALVPFEIVLLRQLDRGMTVNDIAYAATLSPNTVRTALRRLYVKLEARGSREALHTARQRDDLRQVFE